MGSEFYEAYRSRHELAAGWRQAGKKILGYFCNYTPEELIHSAGMIPVRIRGSAENIEMADAHLPTFVCSYMRSCLDQALKGRYDYLDGVVFPKTCDMTRGLYSIWKKSVKLPYYWFLPVPGKSTEEAVELFSQELCFFKESLEEFTGGKISDESLKQAIKVCNENRSLMRQVCETGLSDSHPYSGSEVYEMLLAGLVLPKEEHNAMLRKSLDSAKSGSQSSEGKVRLMLSGNTFENIELVQTIEECGGDIVVDDLDIGTRRYWSGVDENSDPLKALAERYLRKIPCPCKHPAVNRLEHMLELAKNYRVKGVILVTQKYCDTHLYDRPWIESRLTEEGIAVLSVDHTDTGWVGGKFKTMVEAFIEMLE